MAEVDGFSRTPLTLIVESSETSARSLEGILRANGYAVLKAHSSREALRLLTRVRPDLIMVGQVLSDRPGVEMCREIRRVPGLRASTPILLLTEHEPTTAERTSAHQAGAWAVIAGEPDAAELTALLVTYVRAKQDADAAIEESLVDPVTGFYNVRGILKRAREVTADASRTGRPVACVVLGLESGDFANTDEGGLAEELAATLKGTLRVSDTVGRLGEGDFVIVAADTDPSGASRLAERLLARVDRTGMGRGQHEPAFRAGYYAVHDLDDDSVIPVDLLTRATLALRRAQEDREAHRIQPYAS